MRFSVHTGSANYPKYLPHVVEEFRAFLDSNPAQVIQPK